MKTIDGFFITSTCSSKPLYEIRGDFSIEFDKYTREKKKKAIASAFADELGQLLRKYGHTPPAISWWLDENSDADGLTV